MRLREFALFPSSDLSVVSTIICSLSSYWYTIRLNFDRKHWQLRFSQRINQLSLPYMSQPWKYNVKSKFQWIFTPWIWEDFKRQSERWYRQSTILKRPSKHGYADTDNNWDGTSHGHPKTAAKISSYYLYIWQFMAAIDIFYNTQKKSATRVAVLTQ